MSSKILCIIQARMSSTRLPGKVLLKAGKRALLEHEILRIKRSAKIDKIVVATSEKKINDRIAGLCRRLKIDCFRGSENDVLDRFYRCALRYPGYNTIIRVSGDCPLIDPRIIDDVIALYLRERCDYASNVLKETFPYGMAVEIFSRQALAEAAQNAVLPSEREHVTLYIRNRRSFKKADLTAPRNLSRFRLVVDRAEDYEVVKFLINHSSVTDGYQKLAALLEQHPEIQEKNRQLIKHEGLMKSLKHDKTVRSKRLDLSKLAGGQKLDKKQALIVLAGMPIKGPDGRWRVSGLEKGGAGDALRAAAAVILYRLRPQPVVVTGGKGQLKHIADAPASADVIKIELLKEGIAPNDLIMETGSGNTHQQLQATKDIIVKYNFKRVRIISNRYHLPRIRAFVQKDKQLNKMLQQRRIVLISAESVLIKAEPKIWKRRIEAVYRSEYFKNIISQERQGVRDIRSGAYKLK